MDLTARQRAPLPFPRGGRRLNAPGGAPAALYRRTLGGQAAELATAERYPGYVNDDLIRRDRMPWYPTDQRRGIGTAEVDWTAAGPVRPELHMRQVTVRIMAGTSNTRAYANPLDPSVGMHTNPRVRPAGNIERYVSGGQAAMRPGRPDRLSPARYSGQSYSQTTLVQGAKGRGKR